MGKKTADPKPEVPPLFLGEWLAYFGIGSTEAGRIAKCDQSYIANLSNNVKGNPSAAILYRLSEHLDITVNDFYRPPPKDEQIASIADLSPRAQRAVLDRARRKA